MHHIGYQSKESSFSGRYVSTGRLHYVRKRRIQSSQYTSSMEGIRYIPEHQILYDIDMSIECTLEVNGTYHGTNDSHNICNHVLESKDQYQQWVLENDNICLTSA